MTLFVLDMIALAIFAKLAWPYISVPTPDNEGYEENPN